MKELYKWESQNVNKRNNRKHKTLKSLPYPLIGKIDIIKLSLLPKAMFRLNVIHFKIPWTFFTKLVKAILKHIWKHKRLQRAERILKNISKARLITIWDCKTYYC